MFVYSLAPLIHSRIVAYSGESLVNRMPPPCARVADPATPSVSELDVGLRKIRLFSGIRLVHHVQCRRERPVEQRVRRMAMHAGIPVAAALGEDRLHVAAEKRLVQPSGRARGGSRRRTRRRWRWFQNAQRLDRFRNSFHLRGQPVGFRARWPRDAVDITEPHVAHQQRGLGGKPSHLGIRFVQERGERPCDPRAAFAKERDLFDVVADAVVHRRRRCG